MILIVTIKLLHCCVITDNDGNDHDLSIHTLDSIGFQLLSISVNVNFHITDRHPKAQFERASKE